ncbi:MAG: hypothetical protein M1617_01460 [Actinobacteria bacterium]|nr:hypothetical protein [Actinomycetota bacterium]MCL5886960.1 hypothetical protein [Actinomycetota bacterium]
MESKHAIKLAVTIIAGVLLIFGLSGCQMATEVAEQEAERAIEDVTGGQVELDAPAGQLPEGFPEDVPVYDPATIELSSSMTQEGATVFLVTLLTDDPLQDVIDWHTAEWETRGWTVDYEMTQGSGDAMTASFTVSKGQIENIVVLSVVEGQTNIAHQVFVSP